jgi:hypothetical protein
MGTISRQSVVLLRFVCGLAADVSPGDSTVGPCLKSRPGQQVVKRLCTPSPIGTRRAQFNPSRCKRPDGLIISASLGTRLEARTNSLGVAIECRMDKKEIAALLLSSAVIGAFVSAVITAFAQWRERVARERELLLKVAVDFTKTYMERIAKNSKELSPMPDVTVLSTMHDVVKEVFKKGSLSRKNVEHLEHLTGFVHNSKQGE